MAEGPDGRHDPQRRQHFLKLRLRELERHALSMEWMFYRMGFFLVGLSDEYPYLGEKMVACLKRVLLDEAEMVNEIYRRQVRRLESIDAPEGLLEMIHAKKREAEARVDELDDLSPREAFREVEKRLRNQYRRFLEEKTNAFVLQELSLPGDSDDEGELNRELEFLEELEDEESWGNYYSGLDDWEKPLDL